MSENKHVIRKWKGSRFGYNLIKRAGLIDPWTLYYVVDENPSGTTSITEYCGENIVSVPSGQILPVKDVVDSIPPLADINPYDRFLYGTDITGYKIIEFTPVKGTNELECSEFEFDWRYGVRILSKGLKNFVYYDNKLVTYDDVDCGEF